MGGNISKKGSEVDSWTRLKSIGYRFLDVLSCGYISKLERDLADSTQREINLGNRIVSLTAAHKKDRAKWERRIGMKEAENKRLVSRLDDANQTIGELEGKLVETQGELVLTHNQYEEAKEAYEKVKAIIDANEESEGAIKDLEEFYTKLGVTGAKVGKNALHVIRRQKAFVRQAYEKVKEAEERAKETERKGILGRAYVRLAGRKAIFVLDEKHRIEAMSPAAEKLVGKDLTGKNASYIASGLDMMIGYVAPTYEVEFSADTKNLRVNISIERYFGQHIGSIAVVQPRPWYQRKTKIEGAYTLAAPVIFDNGSELTRMINATVALDYGGMPIGMDLRATREISDEIARRIGGLAQSRYFKNKTKIVVGDEGVYSKLIRYNVPGELIIKGFEGDEGLEAETIPIKS
jgi:PAS domain-containing protein